MAVKDSIGGWKDNAFIYKTTKACSTFILYFGKEIAKRLGLKNATCPAYPVRYFNKL